MATSELNSFIREYLKVVATMREYAAGQLEIGFTELVAPFSRMTMEELRQESMSCQRCELHRKRKTVVFGEGNENAELVFVGEAPGAEEDKQGRPFVGRAGELLTKIINAMMLTREDVHIMNVLKCRPPGNRKPEPDEAACCKPFLNRQLELIRPKVICALGNSAAQTLLNTSVGITKLRGKFQLYNGIRLMPTFHPAYLLRNENDKRLVWEDMKKIMAELGIGR